METITELALKIGNLESQVESITQLENQVQELKSEKLSLLQIQDERTAELKSKTGKLVELERKINDLQVTVNEVSSKQVCAENAVGFTAYPATMRSYDEGDIIYFDTVISNYGGGFDPLTGVFECPYTGFYMFYVSVTAEVEENADMNIHLENTGDLVQVMPNFSDYDSASNSAFIECLEGQRVYVRSGSPNFNFGGNKRNSFSGFLVHLAEIQPI